jgi:methyl-accepting chemotaxis protein
MPRLPNVSVVFKLYAILVLLATVTVMLAAVAVGSAHRRTALTSEFEAALQGVQTVERINSLIYAVAMESRGLYLAADAVEAREWAARIIRANDELAQRASDWQRTARPAQAEAFRPVAESIGRFHQFRRDLAHLGAVESPAAARQLGAGVLRSDRENLHRDLAALGAEYARQARDAYAAANSGADTTTAWMVGLSVLAVLLAVAGALVLWRGVARPLKHITRVTNTVAKGEAIDIPYGARGDEIGALSRSIGVFQAAMQSNLHLISAARRTSTPGSASAISKSCRKMSRHSSRRSRAASPVSAPSAIRSWNRPWSCPALPTGRRIALKARSALRRRRRPMCATSPRPPMNWPRRSWRSTAR